VGVEEELKKIRKEEVMANKETAYFKHHYLDFVNSLCLLESS
jgi:hypothetical protein